MEHESYVSLETAKMLKQLGFDWMCPSMYGMDARHNGRQIDEDEEYELKSSGRVDEIEYIDGGTVYNIYNNNKDPYCYSRPTHAVAQRWLREVHHLHITIFSSSQESWMFRITKPHQALEDGVYGEDYYAYEEAQEAGIQKCLTILLEKQNGSN